MINDLLLIFLAWFLSSTWILVSLPFTSFLTQKVLKDGGWAINRVIGWLMIGLPIWYLAHVGLPINTRAGVWVTFFALLGVAAWFSKKTSFNFSDFLKEKKPLIIAEECLFVFGIFFLSIIRGYAPEINSLEKFMDGGLIISYLKSPTLPIEDMWLAGYDFNYYTFGHYQGAIATHFWGIDPVISYNILLGLLMGMSLALGFSVIVNILALSTGQTKTFNFSIPFFKRFQKNSIQTSPLFPLIATGIIGAYLLVFAGNTQTIWYLLARCYSQATQTAINFSPADEEKQPVVSDGCSFIGYWYPNATRFIPRTIHEFPSYSFIVSDLHAHVWNFVYVLALFNILLVWGHALFQYIDTKKNSKASKTFYWLTAIVGTFMGIFVMTSTWDALVYSLFMAVLSALVLINYPQLLPKLVVSGIVIFILMLVVSSAWWLNFDSISEGAAIATEHTTIWHLIALWLIHIVLGTLAVIISHLSVKQAKKITFVHLFIVNLVLSGILLIIIPEFAYIKDIYTTQPRANTMFKLTYQAFIMLSIAMSISLGLLHNKRELLSKPTYRFLSILVFLGIGCLSIYPYFGYRDYYLGLNAKYKSLDGLAWLNDQHPNDYQAYLWLKEIPGRPHILEAVGDSYTTYNRMSAFTGLPTVLGWRVHEWLWRGSYDIAGQRSDQVLKMYEHPFDAESQQLYNQYHVKYVVVGDKEREAYPALAEEELKRLGKIVFEAGTTFIVER